MKNSELQIVVISFSDDFTKNSESLITTQQQQQQQQQQQRLYVAMAARCLPCEVT